MYVKKLIGVCAAILRPLFYLLDMLYPKRNLVAFMGNDFYSDNPRYLFEYIIGDSDLTPIWITTNPTIADEIRLKYGEQRVVLVSGVREVIKSIHAYLISSFVVIKTRDDALRYRRAFRSKRRHVINVSHGVPVKRTGILISNKKEDPQFRRLEVEARRTVDLHLTSSDLVRYMMSASYFVAVNHFPITGYPRNDRMLELLDNREGVRESLNEKLGIECSHSKIILYAPTHRDGSTLGENADTIPQFFPFADLNPEDLNDFLDRNDAVILLRTHKVDDHYGGGRMAIDPSILNVKRAVFCPHDLVPDINEVLPIVDLLWTDYSGIYFDFLLCKKPMIFIPYDMEVYATMRGLMFDYDLFTPGPKVRTFAVLMKESQAALDSPESYREEIERVTKVFHKYPDGASCKRIVNMMRSMSNSEGICHD
jgi:CDP-glycerol glycerophosphotransferase